MLDMGKPTYLMKQLQYSQVFIALHKVETLVVVGLEREVEVHYFLIVS